jgi:O-antigen ligase
MQKLGSIAFVLYLVITVFVVMAYGAVHQPVIALFYFLSALMVALYAISSFREEIDLRGLIVLLPLFLLGLYALFQSVSFGNTGDTSSVGPVANTISLEPFHSRAAAVSILVLCFVSAAFYGLLNSASRIRKYAIFLIVFGSIYAFFAILQSVLSPDSIYGLYKPDAGTPFGSFVNRHNFAAIIEMCIAFPMGLLFAGAVSRDKMLLAVVAISIMLTALLLSGSRGGLVSVVAMVIFISLVSSQFKGGRKIVMKLALSGALIVTAIGGAVFVGGETSFTRIGDSVETEDISSYRSHIWRVTIDVIRDNFPLGAGIGAFHTAYAAKDTASGEQIVEQAHNDYLQIAADAGIVGIVLGIGFLAIFVIQVKRGIVVKDPLSRGIAVGAAGACFAVLVHSLFDFVLHITAIAVVFLGCLVTLTAVARRDDSLNDLELEAPKRKGRVAPFIR